MSYFVTAISTDSGKSVVRALRASSLGYNYWKPVQAGFPTDTDFIKAFDHTIKTQEEQYILQTACSPHEAARIDQIHISASEFSEPTGHFIVEGAGGVAVPINYKGETMLDIMVNLKLPVVLISNTYLGKASKHSFLI